MRFFRSDSLPSLLLTFPSGIVNEYRLRQGYVEFRANQDAWRLMNEADIRLHFVLHTEVAKWLRRESANSYRYRRRERAQPGQPGVH